CIYIFYYFRSCQQLMIFVDFFHHLNCVAIQIEYVKQNKKMKNTIDIFHDPSGLLLSGLVYLL
ncbi:APC family permease, partial [Francisella tularensis subsp. holarctica]|nr:APC family permease [Francisella tularensis subsp. holarctica]